jgi:hypothetical protein
MLNIKGLLSTTLFAASVVLLIITEARAQTLPASPPFVSPPRTCTLPAGPGKSVVIQAGPAATVSDLNPVFPITVSCQFTSSGLCNKWEYRWIYTGVNPSHSAVSFDSNITVFAAVPTAAVNAPGSGDASLGGVGQSVFGERFLRFNANATNFLASFLTPTNVVPNTLTAGFRSGSQSGFCAIAGAGDPTTTVEGLSLPLVVRTETLGCTIEWTQSADGCVTGATVVAGDCTISNETLTTDATFAASCTSEINTQEGSAPCTVSKWNSTLRTWTTVTAFTSPPCTP